MELLAKIDPGRAFVAGILSLALYIFVQVEQNPELMSSLEVTPRPVNLPTGVVVVSENQIPAVEVRVRGARESISRLRPEGLQATIDLRGAGPGLKEYKISVESPDPQVRIVEVIPSKVPMRLEAIVDKNVPVKLSLIGNVPFGYTYRTPKVHPEVVTVSGPSSLVQNVATAAVDVRLEGVTVDVNRPYQPVLVDSRGTEVVGVSKALLVNPPSVSVELPIAQQVSYKTVGVRPVIRGAVRQGYWVEALSAEPAEVTLVGDPQVLARINFVDTSPVDVGDASGTLSRQADLSIPPNISLTQSQPATVTVRVAPLTLTQTVSLVPSYQNLDSGLTLVTSIPSVRVTVRGSAPDLQDTGSDSFRATLDLSGLTAGTHEVNVSVVAPPGISVTDTSPAAVIVNLAPILGGPPPATPLTGDGTRGADRPAR